MSQLASRIAGENRARLTMLRLVCAVSIWRTAMTQVLPLCGAAAWWVTLLCLLPGFAVAALLRLAMHLTCASTLTEAVRACLGKVGTWAVSLVLAALLLVEGLEVNDINTRGQFYITVDENTRLDWLGTGIALSDLDVGDRIAITWSGLVQESSPANIMNPVHRIKLLEDEK